MSIPTGEVAGEDLFAEATAVAEELCHFRDNCFPLPPEERLFKLQSQSDLALQILGKIPIEKRKLPLQRATYEYLRGKILDAVPVYKKEAEDHLSKAVKLNPSLVDAWLCLGNCIWKKGDLNAAKNCFTFALGKGPNKKILCQLSMLERKLSQDAENPEEIVNESIKHAREAITLDVTDGYSWYNLGNGFLISFFVTGSWDHNKLLQALKAYQNAERDEKMKSNPDLYYSCATVNKYLENYERALTGFEAAALMDPGLYAMEDARMIVLLLDKLDYVLRGQIKNKRLSSLSSSLATVDLSHSYKRATMDLLSEGLNKGIAVTGNVLFFAKNESVAPLCYVLSDSNHTCYVITVYGIRNDAVSHPSGAVSYLLARFFACVTQFMRKADLVTRFKKQIKQPTLLFVFMCCLCLTAAVEIYLITNRMIFLISLFLLEKKNYIMVGTVLKNTLASIEDYNVISLN